MNMDVNLNAIVGMLIPLTAVTLGIGMIVVSIVVKHRRQMRELDNRHRERMAAIEKGLDLPPDPVAEQAVAVQRLSGARRQSGSRYLLRGLVWFGIGVALTASNDLLGDRTFGWIGMAIGAAYLIYYALEGRRDNPPPGGGGSPPT
jgi:hypothetical protein